MSTTEQQAAAQSTSAPLTEAEKARLAELQTEIQLSQQKKAIYESTLQVKSRKGKTEQAKQLAGTIASETQKIAQLQSEYQSLKSRAPPELAAELDRGGKRTYEAATNVAIREYGGNFTTGELSASPPEKKIQENLRDLARYYPYATDSQIRDYYNNKISENELAQKDAERAAKFGEYSAPKQTKGFATRPDAPKNVEIDYESTLAARVKGFNVGSGLTRNLPETFAKEEERRFGERNKFIGLVEGRMPEPTPPPPPAPPITPQRTRAKTIQDSPDKAFAAPGYVQHVGDVRQQVHVLDSSLPTSRADLRTGAFELEGQNATAALFGIAPTMPRELTEADIAKMSQAEIDAYNRQVETWNQYAGYVEKQSKAFVEAQRLVSLGTWRENKKELKEFIKQAKEQGIKFVTINTKAGGVTVPIERAAYEIIKTKDVTNISAVPNLTGNEVWYGTLEELASFPLPKGYAVAGSPQGLMLVPEREQFIGPIKPEAKYREGDFLGQTLAYLEELKTKDPIMQLIKGAGKEFVGGLAFGSSIVGEYVTTPLFEGMTGKPQILPTSSYIPEKLTPISTYTGGLIAGAEKAIEKRNIKYFASASAESFANASELAQEQGAFETIGGVVGFIAPSGIRKFAAAALPLKATKLLISTSSGPRVVQRVISVGYREGVPIAGKYGEAGGGKYFVGKPLPQYSGIENIKGATGSSFNVYELAGYSKRELGQLKPIMEYAEAKGLSPKGAFAQKIQEAKALEAFKQMQIQYEKGFAKDELKIISPGIKSEETLGQAAKGQKQKLLEKVTGSVIFTKIKGGLKKPYSDIDITAKTNARGEKAAELILQAPTEPGYVLRRRGSNVFIAEIEDNIIKPGSEKEVINIVTPKDELIDDLLGAGTKKSTVYGYKQPKDSVKFLTGETTKTTLESKGAKQQLTAKVKSISGFMTKETVEEATNLTPLQKQQIMGEYLFTYGGKAHRYVKENVHTFMGFRESARIAFASGDRPKAELFGKAMAGIIKFGKGIDWTKELREYKPTLEIPETKPSEPIFKSVGKTTAEIITEGPEDVSGGFGATARTVSPLTIEQEKPSSPRRMLGTRSRLLLASTDRGISKYSRSMTSRKQPSVKQASVVSKSAISAKSSAIVSPSGRTIPSHSRLFASSSYPSSKTLSIASVLPSPSPTTFTKPSGASPLKPSPSSPISPSPTSPAPSIKPSAFEKLESPSKIPLKKLQGFDILPKYPKVPFAEIPKVRSETDKTKGSKKPTKDFLGNASEEEIGIGFNRTEIITGKRAGKQLKKDILFTRKKAGYTKFVTQTTGTVLSKKKRSILEREKPKEVKRQKKKTGGFF